VSRERREVDVAVILRSVAKLFNCSQQELLVAKRGQGVDNVARSIAMKICQEQGGMQLAEIGLVFSIASVSGVTKAISRLNQKLALDKALSGRYSKLCQDLIC
jgi:chromosomal replication initiation ATPase DnaA